MQRMKLSLACLLCLSWGSAALAQSPGESDLGIATLEDYSGGMSYGGAYFDVRTMTGDGVGYRNGFTQLGVVYPVWMDEDMYIAPNIRMLVTDNSEIGVNAGMIARRYNFDRDRIFGAYGYFDHDNSVEGFSYQQVMFGIETLGERWDARINAYIPTTSEENFVRPLRVGPDPIFFGNSLGFIGVGLFQEAVAGADFEVGGPLTKSTPWLRGYVGAYAYDADANDPVGVRARIEAWISNDLSVGVNVTEDRNFGTNVNAVVDFRFAGWNPTRYFPQWTTRERMMMPVQRNWRVATANTEKDVLVAGTNPATGNPYFVVHVNQTNPLPGDGTWENPFTELPPNAPGADIILVQRDGTDVTPLNGPITLFDNQRLLGEGKAHMALIDVNFAGLIIPTQNIVLPGIETDGLFPILTSPGNIINIANNNEVSAFNLVNAGGFAITNNPMTGSNNFNLNCLNITDNNGGIFLTNATGVGSIRDVNALNNTLGGISITSGASPLSLSVSQVTSNSNPFGTQPFGMRLIADPGAISAVIEDSQFNGNVDGLIFDGNNGSITATVADTNIDDNTNNGIRVEGTNSFVGLNLSQVFVRRSGAEGILATTNGGGLTIVGNGLFVNESGLDNVNLDLTNTLMSVELRNSQFNDSVAGSGVVVSNSGAGGTGSLILDTITATGNALDGVRVVGSNLTNFDTSLIDSNFSNNGRDAIAIEATSNAVFDDFLISGVTANNSGRHGLNFTAQTNSILDLGVTNTTFNNSGDVAAMMDFGNGINGLVDNSTVDVSLMTVSAFRSAQHGLFLDASNGALVTITGNGVNLQNSGQNPNTDGDAVHLVTDSNADVELTLSNAQLNNTLPNYTQRDGLHIESTGQSVVSATLLSSNLANNRSNAIDALVDDADVTVNLQDVAGNNSGSDGILFDVSNGGIFNLNAVVLNSASNNFDNSGTDDAGVIGAGDGINGQVASGGTATFNVFDTTFRNSASNGFRLNILDDGSSFTGIFVRSNFSDSGAGLNGTGDQDAFHIVATDLTTTSISLLNTPTQNTSTPPAGTQERGLYGDISNGASLAFFNQGGNMSNNLLHAVDLLLDGTGTNADITLLNTPANNSGSHGFNVDAANEATLTAILDNSSLNNSGTNNAGNALNLFFRDGAVGDVTLQNGTTATNAGDNAVFIDAANANTSVTVTALTSDFSNSGLTRPNADGGNGIYVIAADQSFVGLDIRDTAITNTNTFLKTPQQRGFYFDVNSGAELDASFLNVNMSNHSLTGVEGTVDGPGSIASVELVNSLLNSNFENGIRVAATDQSQLLLNMIGGSVSNNGSAGTFDNVLVTGTDAGTNVEVQFVQTLANNSTRSGFNFVSDDAIFLAQLRAGVSSQNNDFGNGVRFVGTGANAQAVLYMNDQSADGLTTGTNNFSNNGSQVLTVHGGPDADAPLTGAGIFFLADTVDIAAVRISGLADNNGNAADPIANRDIDMDGDGDHDGMYVSFNNVTGTAAFELASGSANGNVDGGLDLNINNVANLAQVVQPSVLTPTDVTIGSPTDSIVITDFEANNNSGAGIEITVVGPANIDGILVNNVTANENGADGLLIDLTDITGAPNLTITNSQFSYNTGNGINLQLDNAPLGNVLIQGNTTGQAFAGGTLNFAFNNLIWTTFMDNNAGSTFDIARVDIDISPVNQVWRPELTPFVTGFQPTGGSDVTTGLTTVNGTLITAGTDPLEDFFGVVLPDGGVPTGSQILSLDFTSFNPGEQLAYELAHTFLGSDTLQAEASLAGSIGTVTLVDGRTATGVFTPTGLVINEVFAQTFPGIAENGLDGIRISQTNGSDIASLVIDDNLITNNGTSGTGNAINFINTASSDILNLEITNNDLSNNATNGIVMENFNGGELGPVTIAGNTITGNTTGNGIRIVNPVTSNNPLNFTIEDNTITGHTQTGVQMVFTTGAQDVNADFNGNTVTGNGTAGVVNNNHGINLTMAANATYTGTFDGNTVSNNNGVGINYTLAAGSVVNADFIDNTINGNGSHGINIPLGIGGQFNSANFYGNTIGVNDGGQRNGGMGVRLIVPNNASFDWALGDSGQGQNLITGNSDAAVGILMSGNATGTFGASNEIVNTSFSNTLNGADPNFAGVGLGIRMVDTASITGMTIGDAATRNTLFTNNASHGLSIYLSDFTDLNGTTTIDNVLIDGNTGNGLDVLREGSGQVNLMIVQNSDITDNADGVSLVAANQNVLDRYQFNSNLIQGNANRGIDAEVLADADMRLDLSDNIIDNNGNEGIRLTENVNDATDSRSFTGTWLRNDITDNGADGVFIAALHNLTIGTSGNGNLISLNTQDGIRVTGVGTVFIQGNDIMTNGRNGITFTASLNSHNAFVDDNSIFMNVQDGIEITATGSDADIDITNNDITFNGGDGIEILVSNGFGNDINIGTLGNGNRIDDNVGRGVDILNRGTGVADISLVDNSVRRNRREGVYVINTPSTAQTQVSTSTAVDNTGAVLSDPRMVFNMHSNQVFDNGNQSAFNGTGLVMRVGTSGARNSISQPGGYVSTNDNVGPFVASTGALTGFGGVLASVTNNSFGGNLGNDVIFESFTATAPSATGTAWTDNNDANPANDVLTQGGYQTDPLARLDLQFVGNTGEAADVTRSGAFYNNSDALFKSRTNTQTPAGPFTSATRARNAQRLASRDAPFAAPTTSTNNNASFLYPGVGSSTFRVTVNSGTGGFTFGDNFGSTVGLGVLFGELSFGWDQTLAD